MTTSVRPDEVAKFDALAASWWDPRGPMRPLHEMNPTRIRWIDARLRAASLAGCGLLDVGCGAGLAAESLAALGYDVLGIDAAAAPIQAAQSHAPPGARLAYQLTTAEHLLAEGHRFAAITALEVVEHVTDPAAFIVTLAQLLAPGGMLFVSTLNRTPRAYATAKLGAEYILRLLPIGTHAWRQFVTPAELAAHCRAAALRLTDAAGMTPGGKGHWRISRDLAVNYIACAQR